MQQYSKGLEYAQRSKDLAALIGYRAGEARATRVMGELCAADGRVDEGADLIRESVRMTAALGDQRWEEEKSVGVRVFGVWGSDEEDDMCASLTHAKY